jgi:hypothetical protein
LSFSSAGASAKKASAAKRKAIAELELDDGKAGKKSDSSEPKKKKAKKEKKTLLSFGDDA